GASTITGVFVKLPAGALSDVLGRRRMLLLGSAFFAFPPFLYLLVQEPYTLLGLRFLHGFATAIFSPVAAAAVADLFQQGRGEKLGWFASANEVGSSFGPLMGGVVLAALAGPGLAKFHVTFLIVGGLGVLTFLLALLLPIGQEIPPNPPLAKGGQGEISAAPKAGRWKQFQQGIGEVLSNRPILIASSVEAAMFLGVGALLGFLPLYARNILKLSDAYVGILIWVPLVMAMAGKPVAGRISDRIGRRPVILVGLALCIAMLPLVPITANFVGLLLEGAVFGLGMAIVTPSTTALVADLCKAGKYGAAMGVFGTIWDIGEAAGPILAGVIIFTLGTLETASAYLVAFAAIAGAMALVGLIFGVTV
ncbi:MAG: MFS transporter, partial [Chloroflexota bacterium]